jgi:nitroimidazol reductase NimA-like FMN-containing flavoprotein (pyridoxamine 5'-phosphate oxidase superfamily)
MTIHGFIEDDKKQLDAYKKEHSQEWVSILGEGKFDVIEDNSEWEESGSAVEFLSPLEDTE